MYFFVEKVMLALVILTIQKLINIYTTLIYSCSIFGAGLFK